jgi:hypothetical protein
MAELERRCSPVTTKPTVSLDFERLPAMIKPCERLSSSPATLSALGCHLLSLYNRGAGACGEVVHAVVDNRATHKHPKVRQWRARDSRWTFPFTLTSNILAQGGRKVHRQAQVPAKGLRVPVYIARGRLLVKGGPEYAAFEPPTCPKRALDAIKRGKPTSKSTGRLALLRPGRNGVWRPACHIRPDTRNVESVVQAVGLHITASHPRRNSRPIRGKGDLERWTTDRSQEVIHPRPFF